MDTRWMSRGAAAAERCRNRIKRNGCNARGYLLWTAEEDDIVRALYPDYAAIVRKLERRTYGAVKERARGLGLVPKRHQWLGSEVTLLRKVWCHGSREEVVAAFPDMTHQKIRAVAAFHGMRRPKRPLKRTGIAIIDQIKDRAFELNYSMGDLDELANSGQYFRGAQWLNGHIHHRAIARVVKQLGGELRADWLDNQ